MPLVETLRHHWAPVLQVAGLKVAETAPFYIFSVFVVSYATDTLHYDKTTARMAVMAGALVSSFCIPCCGKLSDKIGRPTPYIMSLLGMGILIPLYFRLLNQYATWSIMFDSILLFGLCWSLVTATMGTLPR